MYINYLNKLVSQNMNKLRQRCSSIIKVFNAQEKWCKVDTKEDLTEDKTNISEKIIMKQQTQKKTEEQKDSIIEKANLSEEKLAKISPQKNIQETQKKNNQYKNKIKQTQKKNRQSQKKVEQKKNVLTLETVLRMLPFERKREVLCSISKKRINMIYYKYYCSKDEMNPDKLFDANYFPGKQCHQRKHWQQSSELLSRARLLGPRISQAKRQQCWADLLNRQADNYRRTEKYQESIECYQQLKRFYEDANQEETVAMMVLWVNMGMVYEMQGNIKQALQIYESIVQESIRITRNVRPQPQSVAFCMSHAARVSQYFKDYQKSERYTIEAERIWNGYQHPSYKINRYENWFRLSKIYHKRQEYVICLKLLFNFLQQGQCQELKYMVELAEYYMKKWVIQVANKEGLDRLVYREAHQIVKIYQGESQFKIFQDRAMYNVRKILRNKYEE